ncbi:MAG: DUF308 domain-containing protein [Ruminococcus sp.]|nr:DUF308 domain-containing protein [Ruminococcus sp.]
MKSEIIKPKKNTGNNKSVVTAVMYLILGIILAFFSNQAVQLLFYIIGILVIVYGVKAFIEYYQNKDLVQVKGLNLGVAITSIIIGILLIVLSNAIEVSIRYILGFFLVYMGVSRLLTQFGFGEFKKTALVTTISNIALIILGIYSIFFSNAVLVIIGWLLIVNAILLFIDAFRGN